MTSLIENILRKHVAGAPDVHISPLIYSGYNSTVIIAYFNGTPSWILKIKRRDGGAHVFDNELRLYRHLNKVGFPFVLDLKAVDTASSLEYFLIPFGGKPDSLDYVKEQLMAGKYSEVFQALHGTEVPEGINTNDFYEQAIAFSLDLLKVNREELEKKKFFNYLHHGDLNSENIIRSDKPTLIDWEYSSYGWPFHDLWHLIFQVNKIASVQDVIKNDLLSFALTIIANIQHSFSPEELKVAWLCSVYSCLLKDGNTAEFVETSLSEHRMNIQSLKFSLD